MNCLVNIGILLLIGAAIYSIVYFIRANAEAQALRRAQVESKIAQMRRDAKMVKDPWTINPQDSKKF